MHGPDRIHAKLKTFWAKLSQHRNIQASTKAALTMTTRPRKAKASGVPFHVDGTVPAHSKLVTSEPQEEHEEMLDDVQDSDENMEDYDEESEEDEGSLYAPSEATSELSIEEEEASRGADLVELPLVDPCNFLLLLPRELRDKIYGYVLRLDTPLSDHRLKVKCISCPNLMCTANKPSWQSQVYEARNLLRTCHQIRDEGKQIFYEVNFWTLHRARLRENPAPSSAIATDSQTLFDRLYQINALKNFKHVNMRISLSPLAYCDLTVPDYVALEDPVALHLFELTQHPDVIASHKLDETAQCDLFRAAIKGLVGNRVRVFPEMRSLTLEVSLHFKKMVLNAPNNPLDRCGITFYIRLKLERRNLRTSTCHGNASVPTLAPGSVVYEPCALQRAKYTAHKPNLQRSTLGGTSNTPRLDPRRHMLSPLKGLQGVQSVEVERCWTVHYREQGINDGKVVIRVQPLRQLWRFLTVSEMLESAGPGFIEFLDPALEYLKTSRKDVVDIIENTMTTAEDIGHLFIS